MTRKDSSLSDVVLFKVAAVPNFLTLSEDYRYELKATSENTTAAKTIMKREDSSQSDFVLFEAASRAPRTKNVASKPKDTSQLVAPKDQQKFKSAQTKAKYKHIRDGRQVIPERGILLHDEECQLGIDATVAIRHWEQLIQAPATPTVSIVQEFYANAYEREGTRVWVRGMWVPFDATSINVVYGLSPNTPDDYQEYLLDKSGLEDMLRTLCVDGASWRCTNGRPVSLAKSSFTTVAKVWLYFVCSNLLPTLSINRVPMERVVLVYCIMKGFSINIGSVISNSIRMAIDKTNAGLPHPTLITALCRRAGVTWPRGEPTFKMKDHISVRMLSTTPMKRRATTTPSTSTPPEPIAAVASSSGAPSEHEQLLQGMAYLTRCLFQIRPKLAQTNPPPEFIARYMSGGSGAPVHPDNDDDDDDRDEDVAG